MDINKTCCEKKIRVSICQGTACFVLGAADLLATAEEIQSELGEMFDITVVPCLGFCNERRENERMPYITINEVPYHDVTRDEFIRLLQEMKESIQS